MHHSQRGRDTTASPPDGDFGVHDLRLPHPFEAAEGADFPQIYPDSVGVAGGVAKLKLAYNLVLPTGIPSVCMTCACHAPFGSDARTKNRTCNYNHESTIFVASAEFVDASDSAVRCGIPLNLDRIYDAKKHATSAAARVVQSTC